MSKTPSIELYDIIRSLTPSEKGYFKKQASKNKVKKAKNYIRLFDLMGQQDAYDEKKIIADRFTRHNQLPVLKKYLQDFLLKCLCDFYLDSSPNMRFRRMMDCLEVLYQKRMYDACKKLIAQAKKTAYGHQKHLALLELMHWEARILRDEYFKGGSEKEIEQLWRKELEIMEQWRQTREFNYLNSRLTLLSIRKPFARTRQDIAEYRSLIGHPLLKRVAPEGSYRAGIQYHHSHSIFCLVQEDYAGALQHVLAGIAIREKMPKLLSEDTGAYISALQNQLIFCIALKKKKEFFETLRKLRRLPEQLSFKTLGALYITVETFIFSYLSETHYYIKEGDFKQIKRLEGEVNKGLRLYQDKLPEDAKLVLFYNMAYLYFGIEDYRNALFWLNRVMEHASGGRTGDVFYFTRIFILVVHFDIGNYDVLEYLVKSVYRYLYKNRRLYLFESIILEFILKKLPRINPMQKEELTASFRELKDHLLSVLTDPFEKRALEYFDFISWLESKISGIPLAEIVRKKALK